MDLPSKSSYHTCDSYIIQRTWSSCVQPTSAHSSNPGVFFTLYNLRYGVIVSPISTSGPSLSSGPSAGLFILSFRLQIYVVFNYCATLWDFFFKKSVILLFRPRILTSARIFKKSDSERKRKFGRFRGLGSCFLPCRRQPLLRAWQHRLTPAPALSAAALEDTCVHLEDTHCPCQGEHEEDMHVREGRLYSLHK